AGNSPYSISFGGWIPGAGILKFPPNMGLEIPAGADYVIDIHYPPGSEGEKDSSKLYLKFSNDPNVRPIHLERYLYGSPPSLINAPLFISANTVKTFNEKSIVID